MPQPPVTQEPVLTAPGCEDRGLADSARITVVRWPKNAGCEVALKGEQNDLRPLIPILVRILDGAVGHRQLTIKLKNLRSLAGIEALPRLDSLYIFGAPLSDLGPIVHDGHPVPAVAELTSMILRGSSIADLTPLSGLTTLESLEISDNADLLDIGPLGRLTRLRYLALYDTAVTDVTALGTLTALEELRLARWTANDEPLSLRPLARLRRLVKLTLTSGVCFDLDALEPLTMLTELNIHIARDLGPIPDLPRLEELRLTSSLLDNIDALRRAPQLISLVLSADRPIGLLALADIATLRSVFVLTSMSTYHIDAEIMALRRRRPDLRLNNDPVSPGPRPDASLSVEQGRRE